MKSHHHHGCFLDSHVLNCESVNFFLKSAIAYFNFCFYYNNSYTIAFSILCLIYVHNSKALFSFFIEFSLFSSWSSRQRRHDAPCIATVLLPLKTTTGTQLLLFSIKSFWVPDLAASCCPFQQNDRKLQGTQIMISYVISAELFHAEMIWALRIIWRMILFFTWN